jgi:hypothetical protein
MSHAGGRPPAGTTKIKVSLTLNPGDPAEAAILRAIEAARQDAARSMAGEVVGLMKDGLDEDAPGLWEFLDLESGADVDVIAALDAVRDDPEALRTKVVGMLRLAVRAANALALLGGEDFDLAARKIAGDVTDKADEPDPIAQSLGGAVDWGD